MSDFTNQEKIQRLRSLKIDKFTLYDTGLPNTLEIFREHLIDLLEQIDEREVLNVVLNGEWPENLEIIEEKPSTPARRRAVKPKTD